MISRQSTIENRKLKAFTLIELLVVIAIISLLVSILIPSLSRAKELARKTICTTQQKQIGTAFAMYTSEEAGYLPATYLDFVNKWYTSLAHPYLGHSQTGNALAEELQFNASIFTCPTLIGLHPESVSKITYGMNWCAGYNADIEKITNAKISSETCLAGDGHYKDYGAYTYWVGSIAPPYDGTSELPFPDPAHSDDVNFLYMDLHVGCLPWDDIPYESTTDEGERFWLGK